MIKIGYFGDGPWASLVLLHIVEQRSKFSIAFITPRFDTQDPELKKWTEKLQVPFLPHANINDASFIEKVKDFGRDERGVIVKTGNGILLITKAKFMNDHDGSIEPFIPTWRIGTRITH